MKKYRLLNNKTITKTCAIILIVLMCFIFASCGENNEDFSYMVDTTYQSTNVEIINEDKYGTTAIKINEERDIKVLQITDVHLGNGSLTVKKDRKAINAVCRLIEDAKPDLIILTGDIVYPNSSITGSSNNLAALKIIADLMESYKTPWTMCFGNHDAEWMADYDKTALCDLLYKLQLLR